MEVPGTVILHEAIGLSLVSDTQTASWGLEQSPRGNVSQNKLYSVAPERLYDKACELWFVYYSHQDHQNGEEHMSLSEDSAEPFPKTLDGRFP